MNHQTDCAHSLQAKRTTKQVQKKRKRKEMNNDTFTSAPQLTTELLDLWDLFHVQS